MMGYINNMKLFYCSKCSTKSEFTKDEYNSMVCKNKDCNHIFGSSGIKVHGINMNPMSRRTDVEFNEMSVNESADRMAKASRPRTLKTGNW